MSMRKPNKNPRQINPKMTKTYDALLRKFGAKHQAFKPEIGKKSQLRKTGKRG